MTDRACCSSGCYVCGGKDGSGAHTSGCCGGGACGGRPTETMTDEQMTLHQIMTIVIANAREEARKADINEAEQAVIDKAVATDKQRRAEARLRLMLASSDEEEVEAATAAAEAAVEEIRNRKKQVRVSYQPAPQARPQKMIVQEKA